MRKLAREVISFALLGLVVLVGGFAHAQADKCFSISEESIKKQQRQLSFEVTILENNFNVFMNEAYPKGTPFVQRYGSAEREAAWMPNYKAPKDVVYLNDGLGCITFITKSNVPPSLCGPVDLQAKLAMEALRENWENSKNAVGKDALLDAARNTIPILFAEEKT